MAESFDDGFADLPYIHEAAKRGHADQVKELVDTPEGKKDVNSTDPLGNTPLLWAVMGDHDECVKVLLGAGADVKALNLNKDSALHRAAWRNARKSIRLLLDAGADIFKEAKNADGKTPVDLARDVETRALVAPKIVDAGEDYDFEESDDGPSGEDAA